MSDYDVAAGESLRAEAGPLAALRSRTGVSLVAATVLASGVASYDGYVVNVAVPAISRHFGAGVAAVQWTLTSYLLAVAALLLLAGALADRFGRRRVLAIGLVVMLVSSVLCTSATSIEWLIAARAAQGVGAAFVVPISLALLNGTLRDSDRPRGIGVWAGLSTLAASVGPYVGGWLVDHASWRWVFLLNVPLIVLALAVLRHVPETSGDRRSLSLDAVGALLGILGLGGLINALTDGAGAGWTSARVLVAFVVGGLALAALVPAERHRRAPLLNLSLFASRQFDAINLATVLFYGALSAAGHLIVVELELRLGYTASEAGAALIPATAVFLVLAPLSGGLVARVGPRWPMVVGILLVAGSQVWLAQLHHHSSCWAGDPPRGVGSRRRARAGRDAADGCRSRGRSRRGPRRGFRDQRRRVTRRRLDRDRAGAGADRCRRREQPCRLAHDGVPRRDARERRPLRRRGARHVALRLRRTRGCSAARGARPRLRLAVTEPART